MSKIALSPNASGTATFTLAAPGTNTDRTLTLPDATGTVFVSGQALSATTGSFSGDVTLGSSVLATPSGSAPSYLCRAWVNFNGALSGSIAPRASGNVSSVTKNGTGDYTVNFTTAMPDANYSALVQDGEFENPGLYYGSAPSNFSTASVKANVWRTDSFARFDRNLVCVSIFR